MLQKACSWRHLCHMVDSIRDPWIIVEDFNATLSDSDRKGCVMSSKSSTTFQSLLSDYDIRDMGFQGPQFTWSRGFAEARLDNFYCNDFWDSTSPSPKFNTWCKCDIIIDPSCFRWGIRHAPPLRYFTR
ncbi:hypothetical protein V6N13_091102 [Hibiscus sabdariffa]